MARRATHAWTFRTRFRAHAFGWKGTALATRRLREAVREIKQVAKNDPVLAGEGGVLLIERLWPALQDIDSSSGAIGTAVNHTVDELVDVLVAAPADAATRAKWLDRAWDAYQEDGVDYTYGMAERWGEICGSKEVASSWADRLIGIVRMSFSPDPKLRGYFRGTPACMSALFSAERYEELLALVDSAPYKSMWHDRQWGVRALVALGRRADAIRYAEASRGLNDSPVAIARACEDILLSSGMVDEAYERYAIAANRATSNLATFRAIVKKYPHKRPNDILQDLVNSTPGDEGKWFATAKELGLYDVAIVLARTSPCDPRTLARACRDHVESAPAFAVEAGFQALHWIAQGHGYEITSADIWAAWRPMMQAAQAIGRADEVRERVRMLVSADAAGGRFLGGALVHELVVRH